jgi:hypothetical protein
MFKLLKSNLREVVALLIIIPIATYVLLLLGSEKISSSGPLSVFVSQAVVILSGVLKFAVVLALAWFGLAVTWPEGNRFIVGASFDDWWKDLNVREKAYITLAITAVLIIAAAICMAA